MEKIKRTEILFYYDGNDWNPNGDATDNTPRYDEETQQCMASSVRIKRTVRDYWLKCKKLPVFLREETDAYGVVLGGKGLIEKYIAKEKKKINIKKTKKNLIKEFIDMRVFGCMVGTEKEEKGGGTSIAITGPTQFNLLNRSKNRTELIMVPHSHVVSSGSMEKQKKSGTMSTETLIPWALMEVYGIINENAAEKSGMVEKDQDLLLEGLWEGTNNLITSSKFCQRSRLLIAIKYKEGYNIGDLRLLTTLDPKEKQETIRNISEISLDITNLIKEITKNKDKIDNILYKRDDRLKMIYEGKEIKSLSDVLKKVEEIKWK